MQLIRKIWNRHLDIQLAFSHTRISTPGHLFYAGKNALPAAPGEVIGNVGLSWPVTS